MNPLNRSMRTASFRCGLLIFPAVFLFAVSSNAQDNSSVKFGKVKAEDFIISSPLVDSNANAVILYDRGDISFEGNKSGWFSYIFKRSTRIKILDKKSFDLATVELQLSKAEDGEQKAAKISGVSYNLENGKVIEARLNEKDIFEQKYDKTHYFKKFAIPGVKEDCIIEYTYTIKSDFIFTLPAWKFQSVAGATLWSEYNVSIPALLSYMSVFQGLHKFDVDKSGSGEATYSITQKGNDGAYGSNIEKRYTVSSPLTKHTWAMKDVPAFNIESYISSSANYLDKISFQLFKTYDGESSHDVANDWKNVAEKLIKREDFGKPLEEENYWLDELLASVVQPNDNILDKAKKIYYYVQNNYTCNDHNDIYITTSLKDVIKKKSGTVGDINLLLISMLRHEKINAMPVVLSTTAHGHNSSTYPFLEQLNYLIGAVNINSTAYYLDATIPFLAFGKLPLDCYNGHARLISRDTTAIYFEPQSLKETSNVNVVITNENNNKGIEGLFIRNMGFFESLNTKTSIARASLNSYETGLRKPYPESMEVNNIKVDSFASPDAAVAIKFNFKLTSFGDDDIVYFNPMMGEAMTRNPFFAAERMYPVEMPYTTDYIYNLRMQIPIGYKVEEMPKPVKSALNGNEGFFDYLISIEADTLLLKCRLALNKANFAPDDYQTLRDFYASVVKKQAEQIVFRKIK